MSVLPPDIFCSNVHIFRFFFKQKQHSFSCSYKTVFNIVLSSIAKILLLKSYKNALCMNPKLCRRHIPIHKNVEKTKFESWLEHKWQFLTHQYTFGTNWFSMHQIVYINEWRLVSNLTQYWIQRFKILNNEYIRKSKCFEKFTFVWHIKSPQKLFNLNIVKTSWPKWFSMAQ